MWDWHDGWDGGGWLVMTLASLVFWGLAIRGLMALVRDRSDRPASEPGPEAILSRRFAAGDVDGEDYRGGLQTVRTEERSGAAGRSAR